jgi:hypothetical protein
MLKKALKIKGVEGRTALTEFAVNKRVKFLEYLTELHSEEGALWMNTVQLNLSDIGRYFNIAEACLPPDRPEYSKAGVIQLPVERSAGASSRNASIGEQGPLPESASATPIYTTSATASAPVPTPSYSCTSSDYLSISIANAPAAIQQRSGTASDWTRYYLPCYAALAISLSEILLIPIGGDDFVECFYGLLVELEVAYAGGPASKALAQRNLRYFRQHLSPSLKALLQTAMDAEVSEAPPSSPAAAAASSADIDAQIKYLFLSQRHLEYTAASPSYDAVIPALCSVLMFAYRKLCDYELMKDEECVKRILSIDKRLERLFFKHITHELDKIANYKLLREAYILSPGALFAELNGVGRGGSAGSLGEVNDFVSDLLNHQQQRRSESSPAPPGKKAFDSSDDDEDVAAGWSSGDEHA